MTEEFLAHLQTGNALEIELSLSETTGLPAGFKPTKAFKKAVSRIDYALNLDDRRLALLVGDPGTGKTLTAQFFAQRRGALFWKCPPKYEAKHLLDDICKRVGIDAGSGWRVQTSGLIRHLEVNPITVFLDECHRMDYTGFDLCKYIADDTESRFVFLDTPFLEERIKRWPDIRSRIGVTVHMEHMSEAELVQLYGPVGFGADVLGEIHRETGGVMRLIGTFFTHLSNYMNSQDPILKPQDLKAAHVRKLARTVL